MNHGMTERLLTREQASPQAPKVYNDLSPARLVEIALANGEGRLASNGSLVVDTGERTGRSPNDRYVVDDPKVHDKVRWGKVNVPIARESYERICQGVAGYLFGRELYVVHGLAGANRDHARKVCVVCERASQALFIHQMLVRPTAEELANFGEPDIYVLAAPGYRTDPETDGVHSGASVILDLAGGGVIVAGTGYSGEIKKAVFSFMNYLLPSEDDVLSMHCSANIDPQTGETAVLFGLSGTGKTTLSADPNRLLIGDDEHGWSKHGVFNIEGGCYAKAIDLSPIAEPDIYEAIRFGAVCENVILDDESREPDYTDVSRTQNTRVAYPVEHIKSVRLDGRGDVPSVVLFLTCDAFGVLPPISRLSREGAMYHFMAGFTSKVAGTEEGVKEPQPTFSALFGEPFMPLAPGVYARMLGERIDATHARVYLVNTGWQGGAYGTGYRISLAVTRSLVTAALSGDIDAGGYQHDDRLNLEIPRDCPGVSPMVLSPRNMWATPEAYDEAAEKLAAMFEQHAHERYPDLDPVVLAAGPHPLG